MEPVLELVGSVKNYEWGKLGHESIVSFLQNSSDKNFIIDCETPYAELWIGTHSSGPSLIGSLDGSMLSEWIADHPECLGENMKKIKDGSGLPFLLKVLSVNKPLSIQVHPDKTAAVELHEKYPQHYPDDNHKPEMAIALSDFKALCGFRPVEEIVTFLDEIPQLSEVIGSKIVEDFKKYKHLESLKSLFTSLMTCSPDVFQPHLSSIAQGFESKKYSSDISTLIGPIFLDTHSQYPGDIGCFCFFFLNYIELNPGEAIFLAANEPHAYLYGDCVECMACSDNVIRAGLTPKFRDVQTLCDSLSYKCKSREENMFSPVQDPLHAYVNIYDPPVDEFAVDSISLQETKSHTLKAIPSASILLVVDGMGSYVHGKKESDLKPGTILFISSDKQVLLVASSALLMFRAYCS